MESVFTSQILVRDRLSPLIREIVDLIFNVIFLFFVCVGMSMCGV